MSIDWMARGNCVTLGADVNTFFGENEAEMNVAKLYCENCPVTRQCLKAALEGREYGVWGGTSRGQRESMREAAA